MKTGREAVSVNGNFKFVSKPTPLQNLLEIQKLSEVVMWKAITENTRPNRV